MTHSRQPGRTSVAGVVALAVAAAVGTVHGVFSLYWAAGGEWLLGTLGRRLVDAFADDLWLLAPIGAVKIVAAAAPLALAMRGWPAAPASRALAWLAAAALLTWGVINTVVGQLVLAGVIRPGDYDRDGMLGHAWLWDPLFAIWGLALAVGLAATRAGRSPLASAACETGGTRPSGTPPGTPG